MQLKLETDYAIRILIYLTKMKRMTSAKEIASTLSIPISAVPKIARKMCQKGWLVSETGLTGGYYLKKDPKDITLLDVMQLMESHIKINRCLEKEGCYQCHTIDETCAVHIIYQKYQDYMEWYFKSLRIIDLITEEEAKKRYKRIMEGKERLKEAKENGKKNEKDNFSYME